MKAGDSMRTLSGCRYGTQSGHDLITVNVHPPIPTRDWDWCAYTEGEEEKPWMYGWGVTEKDAIADWRRLRQEAFDLTNQPTGDHADEH